MDINTIATVATAIGVWFAFSQSRTNQKQLHLATLNRCINEFRNYAGILKDNEDTVALSKYVDLVNEELFYMKYDYLPKEVAYEWIDGMIDFIPITNKNEEVLNPDNCLLLLKNNRNEYFKNYPRLKVSFIIRGSHDFVTAFTEEAEKQTLRAMTRKMIVEEIYNNIKFSEF